MSEVFVFVLLTLTAYRGQRVITRDEWPPSEWFRGKVEQRFGPDSSWYTFVTCHWCLPLWLNAALIAAVGAWWYSLPLPVLWWLGVSAGVGLLGELESG